VFSVHDILQAGIHGAGNEFVDQLVKGFSDFWGGFVGGVDGGVNEHGVSTIGRSGDEPIQLDPEDVPHKRINGKRQSVPGAGPFLVKGVSRGAGSCISDGVSGAFQGRETYEFVRWHPNRVIVGTGIQLFVGSEIVLVIDANGVVTILGAGTSTMTALEASFVGLLETAFV